MKRVFILVEGQTEEAFVNNILSPNLIQNGILVIPILLTTKRVKNLNASERSLPGRRFKGGISNYKNVKRDVLHQLTSDRTASAVTTMIDYYGLPTDFPGHANVPAANCYQRVQFLEDAFAKDIDRPRFRPFFVLHEFEGLLFSNTEIIAEAFPSQNAAVKLAEIRSAFQSPEEINEGPKTHPSARLTNNLTGYQKVFHGSVIAGRIGLDNIRDQCDHFNRWFTWLSQI